MKVVELAGWKDVKEGRITIKSFLKNFLEGDLPGEMEAILLIGWGKAKDNGDRDIIHGWSDMSLVEAIGLLEVLKRELLCRMEEA
jgi:hypothetical protein